MALFFVGQRVVCIDDDWDHDDDCKNYPVKGCVYTIRGFGDSPDPGESIFLEEIVNPPYDYPQWGRWEPSFLIERFRPVKNTSIEVFQSLLAPTPARKLETTSLQDG